MEPWVLRIKKKSKEYIYGIYNAIHGTRVKIPTPVFNKEFVYTDAAQLHAIKKDGASHDELGTWLKQNGYFDNINRDQARSRIYNRNKEIRVAAVR